MAASRVLVRPVAVRHPGTGVTHRFQAGETLPVWAAKKAKNPTLFEHSTAVLQQAVKDQAQAQVQEFGVGSFEGRDRKQLLALARRHDIDVKDNARHGELIALLQAEGVSEDEGDAD